MMMPARSNHRRRCAGAWGKKLTARRIIIIIIIISSTCLLHSERARFAFFSPALLLLSTLPREESVVLGSYFSLEPTLGQRRQTPPPGDRSRATASTTARRGA